uniref:Transporter n=1 Tax=Trypanosoma vivax (strain Y486) TaxID=1055687 RepID=G0U3G1_TRYVY|nr:conserved hypothetical protein [Trypanosoma vivax Y486]
MGTMQEENRILVIKICSIWALTAGSWAVLSINTPLLLDEIAGKEVSPTWQGVFTATTALSGMLFCGVGGYYSDRVGRMEFLIPWMIIFSLSTVFVACSTVYKSVFLLWIARVPALSIPSTIIHAILADYMSESALMETYGYATATFGISVLVSSSLCGLISLYISRLAAIIFAAFLAFGGLLLTVITKLPSRVRPQLHSKNLQEELVLLSKPPTRVTDGLLKIYRNTQLRNFILALVLLRTGNTNIQSLLVLFLAYRLKWKTPEVSALMVVGSLVVIGVQLLGVKCVLTNNKACVVLIISLSLAPLVAMAYAFAMSATEMYAVAVMSSLLTISGTILDTKVAALASESNSTGLVLGCVGTLHNSLDVVTSLSLGRLMSWSFSSYPPSSVMSGLPFVVNSAIYVASLLIVTHTKYRLHILHEER